jgi:hypothetical protein
MQNNIDIFNAGAPKAGEFFKFNNIGDAVQGTYIGFKEGVDGYQNQQYIYQLLDKSNGQNKIWNVAFRTTNSVVVNKMKGVSQGQIIGFRFDESRPSKINKGGIAKIIKVYEDPKVIDHEWVQNELQNSLGKTPPAPAPKTTSTTSSNGDLMEEMDNGIPSTAKPAGGNFPAGSPQQDSVLTTIHKMAVDKKIISGGTPEEINEVVAAFAGMPVTPDNYLKILMALTNYTN